MDPEVLNAIVKYLANAPAHVVLFSAFVLAIRELTKDGGHKRFAMSVVLIAFALALLSARAAVGVADERTDRLEVSEQKLDAQRKSLETADAGRKKIEEEKSILEKRLSVAAELALLQYVRSSDRPDQLGLAREVVLTRVVRSGHRDARVYTGIRS